MGFFDFFRKRNKEEYEEENLYEKIKKENPYGISNDELKLDTDIIEEAYEEEMLINANEANKNYIENYCEQIAVAAKRVEDAKKEYNIVGRYLTDIEKIENAGNPYKKNINYYAKRILVLREDKKSMKQYSRKMSETKYAYMQMNEGKIKEILKDMHDDEQYCQSLKTDIHHIEGEKHALRYERKHAAATLRSIRKMSKVFVGFFVITLLMMLIIGELFKIEMLIPTLSVMTVAVVIAAFIVVYNQKETKELKISEIKLNKAISLMNSYKLKYVNVKSRLDYMYETNGVKSSYELNEIWRVYLVVKKEREAIMKASDEMYKSIDALMAEIEKLDLYDASVWSAQIEALVDNREMTEIRHTLNVRRQKLRESMDFNSRLVEKNKEKINKIVKDNPAITKEVIELIEKYERINNIQA